MVIFHSYVNLPEGINWISVEMFWNKWNKIQFVSYIFRFWLRLQDNILPVLAPGMLHHTAMRIFAWSAWRYPININTPMINIWFDFPIYIILLVCWSYNTI